MKTQSKYIPLALLAALLVAPVLVSAQTTNPVRVYAISGTENSRYYDSTAGWIASTQAFTGTFELVTTTNAHLTKVYADGSSVVRDLILQWVVDLNAPVQSGAAAEVPDPTDPLIKRTTYNLSLMFDGLRYTASGNFLTRAYMSVLPGMYDWFVVAYGDFSGFVVSPLGAYNISGSEKSGKSVNPYTGTFTLLSPTTGQLAKVFADGTMATVHLALASPVDLAAASQTISAFQIENQPGQSTSYVLDLQLNGTLYSVGSTYATIQTKGRTSRTVATGAFAGAQP